MKKLFAGIIFTLSFFISFGQPRWDTTYYVKYTDRLVLSTFWSWRFFDYNISQKGVKDSLGVSSVHYRPNTSVAWGGEMDFDKISVALSFRLPLADSAILSKGKSDFSNFSLAVGGNQWIAEGGFRKTTGFYDENTARYDTTIKQTGIYYQIPDLEVRQLKAKFLYFTNHHKFAFKAGYGYTCRQLKSSFTWVLGANIYNNKLSADSSIFPAAVRSYYGPDAYLNRLNVSGISGGGGVGLNVVLFKRLFVNLTEIFFIEPQWRTYSRIGKEDSKLCYISASNDFRASIAINAKNFFISLYGNWDIINMDSGNLSIASKAISGAFSIGYRFKVKTPKFYKKFQETRVYKML